MRFFNQSTSSVSKGIRARDRRFTGGRRARIGLETLETRALMSGIAGVSVQFGNIAIHGTKTSGNVAEVSIDPTNHDVMVSLNGQSEEFSPSLLANVTYKGGSGGGDTFTNNTNLTTIEYGYGGHNTFSSSGRYNYVIFFGNYNTYNAHGGYAVVFEIGNYDTVNGTGVTTYHF
jgi:hypothetical protein